MNKTFLWLLGLLAVAGLATVGVLYLNGRGDLMTPADALATDSPRAVSAGAAIVPDEAVTATGLLEMAPPSASPSPSLSSPPTIADLITGATSHEGTTVVLRGAILTQCVRGCEFALDDGTGTVSVQLEGRAESRLLPQGSVGRRVEIRGVFRMDPRPQIVVQDADGWTFVR